ncbi:MAG: ABC transporter ATP-binding protein [Burkholderiaceae bacterium]
MSLLIDGLRHGYAGAPRPALDGVALRAGSGRVLGLLGPNGAGKTTLISLLAGVLPLREGRVLVDGEPLPALRARAPTHVAVAPQEYAFYAGLTVRENLACFAAACRLRGARRRERIEACLALAQLERFAGTRAERLSGGLKRRLNLAITLLPEPALLLFDEPTVGVDPQSRAFILDAIRALAQAGRTVIYASHYMDEIEAIADDVAILDHGRVLRAGTLPELLADDSRRLSLVADGCSFDALQALLAPFGGVEPAGGGALLSLGDTPVAAVFAALDAAGVRVRHAELGRRNLEQLFMALTDRSLRDDA